MFRGHEIIAVVPAGRQATLQLLVPHLLAASDLIDECHLWVNTIVRSDLVYLESLEAQQPGFFRRIPSRVPVDGNKSVACFYGPDYRKREKIYIKLDDDIVWMAPDAIRNLLEFRTRNPQYFLVFSDIWNNQLCDHLHQRTGLLPDEPFIDWNCGGNTWSDGRAAERIHRHLLQFLSADNAVKDLCAFERWHLRQTERCSINLVCWLGEDLSSLLPDGLHGPLPTGDDEHYFCCVAPRQLGKSNVICGNSTVAHYSFGPQKSYLDGTDILRRWQDHQVALGRTS